MYNYKLMLAGLCTLLIAACTHSDAETQSQSVSSAASPVKTTLAQTDDGYTILRNGEPYFIKGAGGRTRLALLAKSGANSLRTWDTDNAKAILDEAHKHGLTVMLGLRLGHERHGFDYSDKDAVAKQKAEVRKQVLKYKDHPALLTWGIGNEVDLFYTNKDVWFAVQDIAAMIKKLDPNHLITTVTAGIDKEKLELVLTRVPDIDYLSINIYGGLESLPQDLMDMGYDGPYVVTEWGPTGHWQVERTDWDVPIEQTSTQKAASYRSRYEGGIQGAPGRALGSYAFLWGQKQETTPTWYGVFTEAGYPNEVVDSLYHNWNGEWPEVRAPSIQNFTINGKQATDSIHVQAAESMTAKLTLKEYQDDGTTIRWEVLPESTDIKAGGDPEARPKPVEGLIVDARDGTLTLTAPTAPGGYRLFAYALSGSGKVATANIPFYLDEK
ncbi:glycoside hydrolase family 2 TIM barrel-domain containing protein [Salinimonas iocasae]|uniref:Glycoside hydrolase family 2 catalytic domain-containing protein n=1 Tax=Salinimonas iocasae TaxID=2572577 RepID=A0A5B7YGD2_9ALTE|nr:glycoside hydrolase family 2 TIM barrel-domain containing protein [Salinimonas iocasae]QCZ94426.1 hypothetical protein FBQ74_13545 [Salinimonas iocasae]